MTSTTIDRRIIGDHQVTVVHVIELGERVTRATIATPEGHLLAHGEWRTHLEPEEIQGRRIAEWLAAGTPCGAALGSGWASVHQPGCSCGRTAAWG